MFSPKLNLVRLIVITIILFIIWGCPGPVPPPDEGIPLQDFRFSYLQEQNELYFAVQVEPSYQGNRLDSVRVAWYGTDPAVMPDTIPLNDSGQVGDIIAFDDVYARKVKNDTAFINNVVSISDTGLVYIDYLAYYKALVVAETDSFSLGNIRPRILSVTAPDTVVRPGTGYILVKVECEVFDANGLEDIRWVGFRSYNTVLDSFMNGGNYIFLYDDGGEKVLFQPDLTSGDAVRGDGIYSFQAPLSSSSTAGTYDWIFEAQDQHNAYSDTVVHRIVVQ